MSEIAVNDTYLAAYLITEGHRYIRIRASEENPEMKEFVFESDAMPAVMRWNNGNAVVENMQSFSHLHKATKSKVLKMRNPYERQS